MSNSNTIALYTQVEQTADMLIAQLMKIKEQVKELRSSADAQLSGKDTEQSPLSDADVAGILNRRHRSIVKRFAK